MSKNDSSANEDVVRQLADILNETNLTEIEYEKGDCRIRVARQITVQAASFAPVAAPVAPAVSAPVAPEAVVPADKSKQQGK